MEHVGLMPGEIEPHDDIERTIKVVRAAYEWTLDIDGRVCGLVAGDMGYESTHIVIPADHIDAFCKYWMEKRAHD